MIRKKQNNLKLDYVDIKAVLESLGIPYSSSGKNVSRGWIGTQCPFPGCGDRTNHLGINLSQPVVSCWNCGKSGNYLTYLSAKLGSFPKAISIIEKYIPRELKQKYRTFSEKSGIEKVYLPKNATKEPSPYHIKYLKDRNFDPKELDLMCDFYYCGPLGPWANRIIVPIYQFNQLVTFTSIDISIDSKLRYKHLEKEKSIVHCKNLLYGEEQVVDNTVMVVEGFFDRARIGMGAVCTFGTKLTQEQMKRLSKYRKVIVVFDGDDAGNINGKQISQDLAIFTEVELITLPDETDPDKLSDDDVNELKQMLRKKH